MRKHCLNNLQTFCERYNNLFERNSKLYFQHEEKRFNIKLEQAGKKTCVVVDYGDDDSEEEDPAVFEFYGNVASCRIRFPALLGNS